MGKYGVYVLTDEAGRVVAVECDAFIMDTTGWTKIDEGTGDRFHHAQNNYFAKPLFDDNGAYRYKLEGGAVVERTAEEMAADVEAPKDEQEAGDVYARVAELENRLAAYEAAYMEGVQNA